MADILLYPSHSTDPCFVTKLQIHLGGGHT
jgi:hypothetical protein